MRFNPIVTGLLAATLFSAGVAQAKELKSIGVTVGDLANPFFVQITKGAEMRRVSWPATTSRSRWSRAATISDSRSVRLTTLLLPKWT